jgi:hypothetical protein
MNIEHNPAVVVHLESGDEVVILESEEMVDNAPRHVSGSDPETCPCGSS